jgi:hypothetical protein
VSSSESGIAVELRGQRCDEVTVALILCSDQDVSGSASSSRSSTSAIATQGTEIKLNGGRLSHLVAWSRKTLWRYAKEEPIIL